MIGDFAQPGRCERCSEPGIAHNDDGDWLCEDCLFQEACEAAFPDLIGYNDRD